MRVAFRAFRGLGALVCLVLACAASGWAIDLGVRERVLPNGLTVLVVPRGQVPLVTVQTWVRAGSADETLGKTGLAHFHEHLLFKGTETIGTTDYQAETELMERQDALAARIRDEERKGRLADAERIAGWREEILALEQEQRRHIVASDYDRIYTEAGGTQTNAGTWYDYTAYYATVPANKLELAMWMESDRLLHPVFREFYSEREVVAQERRQTLEDVPSGPYRELLDEITFPESSYQWDIGGHLAEILRLTREDAYAFFRAYYVPANMCVVVAGDLEPDRAFALAERYFGRLPAAPTPGPILSTQRRDVGERRVRVEADATPTVDLQCITTPFGAPDDVVLDVIAGLLDGEGGRLNRELVIEKRVALACSVWNGTLRATGEFAVTAVPAPSTTHEQLEAELWAQFDRLASEPVRPEELARVKKQARAGFLRNLRSNDAIAEELGRYWAEGGDWRPMLDWPERVALVTEADVQRVAGEYLRRGNAAIGWLVTKPTAPDEDAASGEEVTP